MTILTAVLFALLQGEPLSAPLESRVAAYVLLLKDENSRDRARDRLVHLGKPALPCLEKLSLDPELLSSIRREIALNESLRGSYGPLRVFTFDGSEESLGVLVSRLENSTGIFLQKNSVDLSQKIAPRLHEGNFWEALDEICGKASLRYSLESEPMYLSSGLPFAKPRAYYGPVILVLDRVIHQRRITFDRTENTYSIRLLCQWDRSIGPLGVTGRFRLDEITDDAGTSLLAPDLPAPAAAKAAGLVRAGAQFVELTGLRPPAPAATKLLRVRGTLELEFPSQIDEVRFKATSDEIPAQRDIPGATVELKGYSRPSNWGVAADFAIRFRDAQEAGQFRFSPLDLDCVIAGDSSRPTLIHAVRLEKEVFSFIAHWRSAVRQEVPKEIRLRIRRGSVIKEVPFDFKNVELK